MTQESLNNLLPKFLNDLKDKGRSPSTILAYRADLEQLISFFSKKGLGIVDQVTQEAIEAFRDSLLSEKYTPKTVSRKLNAVKTFFRYLIGQNFITKDPSSNVAHPKINVSLPKFLSQLEYRALRDCVRTDPRISAIVELILQTGMRISEVASIKRANIKDDRITVESYATQPQREIPLNKPGRDSLKLYLATRPVTNSEYIFVSKNGKPLAVRNIRAAIDRYMQKADLPDYSVNDLRTTFIVENLQAGVDLVLLSHIVGHKRLSTTERYLEIAGITESGKKQELAEL